MICRRRRRRKGEEREEERERKKEGRKEEEGKEAAWEAKGREVSIEIGGVDYGMALPYPLGAYCERAMRLTFPDIGLVIVLSLILWVALSWRL